jgi:hypothetical protein
MGLKLASVLALGVCLWLLSLNEWGHQSRAAHAEGPMAIADPASGPLSQTFVFYLTGFQPYTRLTLSFLPPGASAYQVVDTEPVFADGSGQAVVPLNVSSLLSGDPNQAQLLPLLGAVNVIWAPVGGGLAYFMVAACDTQNCAEQVGTVTPN